MVALGASNLTRGFHTVVAASAATWGPGVEVVAALGHGRSYGTTSAFLVRSVSGILASGLWAHLDAAPAVPTRALLTDVGNDILYGFSPHQMLDWIAEAIRRLQPRTDDIVLTGLPIHSIRRVSPLKFKAFCAVIAPSCRLSLGEVVDRSEIVEAGLARLAAERGVRFLELDSGWYGVDPIHIRRRFWRDAWQRILGTDVRIPWSPVEALRLYVMRPEREAWFGVERHTPQPGRLLPPGARVWLY